MRETRQWEQLTSNLVKRAGFYRIGSDAGSCDDAILEIARHQDGVVTRAQLERDGHAPSTIDLWLARLRLVPIHSAVYGVGHDVLTQRGRWIAAVLAAGGRAVLSHWSAGGLWGVLNPGRRPVEIVRSSGPGRSWPGNNANGRTGDRGLVIHRTRMMDESDFTVKDGIPVTSLARTYLDLAGPASERQLESFVAEGERMGIIDFLALKDVQERGRGRKGASKLGRVIKRWNPEMAEANPGIEELFLDLCRKHDLPIPVCNVMVEEFEVDCLWASRRLVAELDSSRHHGNRPALSRDYVRDMRLRSAGYEIHRYTHEMIVQHGAEVAESVRSALLRRTR